MTTTVLTVSALDLGLDKAANYMKRVCRGYAVSPGHVQVQVKYPAVLDPSGDSPKGSIQTGARNLDRLIRSTAGEKVVLGYSQGAQVCGAWLRKFAGAEDAPSVGELSFLLIGNPERRFGKQPWVKKVTPDDTQYGVLDLSRRNDNWSDWRGQHNNRLLALFGSIHTNYWNVDLNAKNVEIVRVVGNTTYALVP